MTSLKSAFIKIKDEIKRNKFVFVMGNVICFTGAFNLGMFLRNNNNFNLVMGIFNSICGIFVLWLSMHPKRDNPSK